MKDVGDDRIVLFAIFFVVMVVFVWFSKSLCC